MLFLLVQILYWLALSTWFGGVLFVVVAPPIILRTVRESNPLLPTVLSVNLEGQHGELLAGSIISNLLQPLIRAELVCCGALLVAIVGQWFIIDINWPSVLLPILRSVLFISATVFVIYDWRSVLPKALQYRQEYLDNADDPDRANPALDSFDRYQNESLLIVRSVLFILLGIIIFSADIHPAVNAAAISLVFHP
jgi:hypothetical protein